MFSKNSERWILGVLAVTLAGWPAAPARAVTNSGCETAVPIGLPDRWRGHASAGDDWLRFETFKDGVVALAVTRPSGEPGEPWLEVLDGDCRPVEGGRSAHYLERTPAQALLAVAEPGEYFVRIASSDPRVSLGPYTLVAGVASGTAVKAINPLDDEPDPDPLVSGGTAVKAINPLDDEPDPDPLRAPEPTVLGALCLALAADDHGDLPLCASALETSRAAAGEIDNGWGDDRDEFAFVLAGLQTVEITLVSDGGVLGALYDRQGNRLMVETETVDGNVRIVKTLVGGRYFVRVEGAGDAGGRYQLSVRVLGRASAS